MKLHPAPHVAHSDARPCSIPMMGGPVLKFPFTYTPQAQLEELVNAWAKWEVCCAI